jgi:hypothetical protein
MTSREAPCASLAWNRAVGGLRDGQTAVARVYTRSRGR